jgi:hypothetical protein
MEYVSEWGIYVLATLLAINSLLQAIANRRLNRELRDSRKAGS